MTAPLRVCFATAECAPWVKTGGLGEVAADLPEALRALGHDARVLMPAYPAVRQQAGRTRELAELPAEGVFPAAELRGATLPNGVPALLLDCPGLFERAGGPYLDAQGRDHADNALRFAALSRAAAWLSSDRSPLPGWQADVLHANDWHTGLAPSLLRWQRLPGAAASVMTVHNLAFQGCFDLALARDFGLPPEALQPEGVEYWGQLSFMKAGLHDADLLSTVSPGYAREIQGEALGFGLDGLLRARRDRLRGILNGVDARQWHSAHDPHLAQPYDRDSLDRKRANKAALQAQTGLAVDEGAMLLGMVTRLTEQKGIDLVLDSLDSLLAHDASLQLVLLGSGDVTLELAAVAAAGRHAQRVAVQIGYDERLAHRIEAGADAFLMPSRFEPCGLNQMYSQAYGTPPIVRATGGLADSVVDASEAALADGTATGFHFGPAEPAALITAVQRAVRLYRDDPAGWQGLQRAGMAQDFSWQRRAEQYVAMYREAMAIRRSAA